MAEETKPIEEKMDSDEIIPAEEKINPEDIIFANDSDADMPEQETHEYKEDDPNKMSLRLSPLFKYMFNDCVGKLPYNTVLENSNKENIKIHDLINFVNGNYEKDIMVKDMNTIISFLSACPINIIKPLMELIEKDQKVLWTLNR